MGTGKESYTCLTRVVNLFKLLIQNRKRQTKWHYTTDEVPNLGHFCGVSITFLTDVQHIALKVCIKPLFAKCVNICALKLNPACFVCNSFTIFQSTSLQLVLRFLSEKDKIAFQKSSTPHPLNIHSGA